MPSPKCPTTAQTFLAVRYVWGGEIVCELDGVRIRTSIVRTLEMRQSDPWVPVAAAPSVPPPPHSSQARRSGRTAWPAAPRGPRPPQWIRIHPPGRRCTRSPGAEGWLAAASRPLRHHLAHVFLATRNCFALFLENRRILNFANFHILCNLLNHLCRHKLNAPISFPCCQIFDPQ